MSARATMQRGWCPGALTPMLTGDGLLVRVRPRAGAYSIAQLVAIANVARKCGNGWIDLTNRANLQIRGLSVDSVADAQSALAAAGLIDDDAAVEAVRNIIVSPLSDLDPDACDVRPLTRALEAALGANDDLHGLPGKFGFAVDGGGAFPLKPNLADITLRVRRQDVDIELAGDAATVTRVENEIAVAVAMQMATVFLNSVRRDPSVRRMRDAVVTAGAEALFSRAGFGTRPAPRIKAQAGNQLIGALGPVDRPWAVGLGLRYGRIHANALFDLVVAAAPFGIAELRPSPSRAFIAPVADGAARAVLDIACRLQLITTSDDPRLMMDVCPGAPDCDRGTTHTRNDADSLAVTLVRKFADITSVHVSGCAKGCARSAAADVTFVARDGAYDVVRNGDASGSPCITALAADRLPEALREFREARHA